jgi:hypothetical protein
MNPNPLPAGMAERNRAVIAERLGWPDGALEACQDLEQRHPAWHVTYVLGGVPSAPTPGYRAYLRDPYLRPDQAQFAATPDEMSALINRADQARP